MRQLNTPRRRVSRYRAPTPRDDLRALSRALVREKKELEQHKPIEPTALPIAEEPVQSEPEFDTLQSSRDPAEETESPLAIRDAEDTPSVANAELTRASSRESIGQLETRRRMTDRLSLAPRLSEEFSFAHDHTLTRLGDRKESLAFPNESILEEEVEEPTFRIEFHEEEEVIPEPDFQINYEETNDDNDEMNNKFTNDELMDLNNDDDDDANNANEDYDKWSDLDNDYDAAMEDNATLPIQIPKARVAQTRPARRTREQATALPTRLIKSFLKSLPLEKRVAPSVMPALIEASEAYFEQAMTDLGEYSDHARRSRVDGSDVVQLMRRQRIISRNMPLYAVAKQHLPGELMDLI